MDIHVSTRCDRSEAQLKASRGMQPAGPMEPAHEHTTHVMWIGEGR